MAKNALVYHNDFMKYDFGPGHPLRGKRYGKILDVFGSNNIQRIHGEMVFVKPNPATDENLELVHGRNYLDLLEKLNEKGGFLSLDTPVNPGLYDIARLLAGAGKLAGRLVAEEIFQRSIVLGGGTHHAGFDFGGGFCMVNDIAVAVEYLHRNYDQNRIAIIDIDAHCGNGTQDIFYDTSSVLCIDLHEDPLSLYPGIGFPEQVGIREGKGYTVNIPFPPGSLDEDYLGTFERICVPVITEFEPKILFVVGGADTHFAEPLTNICLSVNGIYRLMALIAGLAENMCGGRLVMFIGASFNPQVFPHALEAMICATIGALYQGPDEQSKIPKGSETPRQMVGKMIDRVKNVQKKYWRSLI